jgi:hypothetical protein
MNDGDNQQQVSEWPWERFSDSELGQAWSSRLVWYLMEMKAGRIMLDHEAHARKVAEMRAIEAEMRRRSMPAPSRYTDAFERRELLPPDEMKRLARIAYHRPVLFAGIPGS